MEGQQEQEQEQEPKMPNESESEPDNLKPIKKRTKPEPVPFQIITRAAKAKMNAFAFQLLPPELKENVFKFLALPDLKSVRVVSREWKIIAYRYIGIKTALLDDSTIPVLKNCRYVVRELSLACLKDGRALRCFAGNQIQKLELKYPKISSAALKRLFMVCPNLEQLHILHFESRVTYGTESDLLRKILPKAIPACTNLKQLRLKIYPKTWESIGEWQAIFFDCSCILECKKLEDVSVVTLAPFYFTNVGPVAKALKLKNFSFLFLAEISSVGFAQWMFTHLSNQIMNSGLKTKNYEIDPLPSQEQLNQFQEFFPSLHLHDQLVSLDDKPSGHHKLLLENLRQIATDPLYTQFKYHIIGVTSLFSYNA